jgi:hypothetical protein
MTRTVCAICAVGLALSITIATVTAAPANQAFVTTSADSGPGSFRAAIEQANANPAITRIQFIDGLATIALLQTVTFTGPQGLTITGAGTTLDGSAATGPAFAATGGGDLAVSHLTVQNAQAEGIAMDVPTYATGSIRVWLDHLDIVNNAGHGVLVDDQDDPLTPILDGDSDASVAVTVDHTRFVHNGYSVSDRDGLRVNEGGLGDLIINVTNSWSVNNAADGIEVDERGDGDVYVAMFESHLEGNGSFDPSDFDDGFDIDESDDGSVFGRVSHSSANHNYEEGFDFNENHAGDLRVDMDHVEASGNAQEGIDYEEDDDVAGGGDLVTTMTHVTANGNGIAGDAGLKIRERGDGDVDATVDHVETSNNSSGGISVREDANGSLTASIEQATSLSNGGHGIDFDENRTSTSDASGDLTAVVSKSTSSFNGGAGVRADQQTPPGTGSLLLSKVTLEGNTGGPTTGSNVVITIEP